MDWQKLHDWLGQSHDAAEDPKRDGPPTASLNEPVRGEPDGSRPTERARELGEDGQVGVQPDPLDATDTQRSQ